MIAGFFTAMFAGHIYVIGMIAALQIISFKEVIAIASVPSREKKLQFTRSLNWYFLVTTMYFLYGESVIYYFKHIVLVDKVLLPFATHHRFISFMLYVIGWAPPSSHTIEKPDTNHINSRVRILRRLPPKRPLSLPIHPIRLDAHGPIPHRRPIPLHNEQHIRRHDLVLPPSLSRNHKRHLGLHLRYNIRKNPINQTLSQENGRRLRRGLVLYRVFWCYTYQYSHAVYLFYLSSQCKPLVWNFPLPLLTKTIRISAPTFSPV
jgi:hypothetical protein